MSSEPSSPGAPPPSAPLSREQLERVRAIAHEAGALVLGGFGHAGGVRFKGESDIVTDYDVRSERFLRAALGDAFPEHGVVGEEGEGPQERDRRFVWYVDPIDGTTNFAHGHPFFCISLGLVERTAAGEVPVAGVITAPALGMTWSAARGLGAERHDARGVTPTRVSGTERLEDALFATGFPAGRRTDPNNNYARFLHLDSHTRGVRRCGAAALELCLMADGSYDGFWEPGLHAWDVAAGAAIIREAGGTVSNVDGSPFELHAGRILASNGLLHERLVEVLGSRQPLPPGVL